jgi:hypothetical protein
MNNMQGDNLYKYNPNKLSYEKVEKSNFINKLFKPVIGIISFIATVVTIYAFFLNEKKSNLEYQILSNINVLDLKEDIGKLDILYDSTSLKKTKSNLKVYTVKLINNGNKEVLIEYFDKRSPLGIQVKSGKVVEKPELIDWSNNYLKDYFQINLINEERLEFNQLIFEPEEFLIVKFLVLHNRKEIPELISFGKIAGQKNIEILSLDNLKNNDSFLESLFKGTILIHIVRAVFFLFVWVVILIILVYIIKRINNFKIIKKRKKIVEKFKRKEDYSFQEIHNVIFNKFVMEGDMFTYQYGNVIIVVTKLSSAITEDQQSLIALFRDYSPNKNIILDKMISEGYIHLNNNVLKINKSLSTTLLSFYNFITDDENGINN